MSRAPREDPQPSSKPNGTEIPPPVEDEDCFDGAPLHVRAPDEHDGSIFDDDAAYAPPKPNALAMKERVLRVSLNSPQAGVFFRAHPTLVIPVNICDVPDPQRADRSSAYLVHRAVLELFEDGQLRTATLFPCVTRQGTPFLWPVKDPSEHGNSTVAYDTALEVIEAARLGWVTRRWRGNQVGHTCTPAENMRAEPVWPPNLAEAKHWRRAAFTDRVVLDASSPVFQVLRGNEG